MTKFAIDCRPLLHPYSGIGRYTYELLKNFRDNRVDFIELLGTKSSLSNIFSANFLFGHKAVSNGADVYFSPRHHLPRFLKLPSVVTIHDLVWRHQPESMARGRSTYDRFLTTLAVREATQIICVSNATAADLEAEFPEADAKINIIPLAPTLTPQDATSPLPDSLSKPYILFVGTNEPRKNLERAIPAYLNSNASHTIDLVMVTNNGWKSSIPTDTPENIHLLVGVSESSLAALYANCEFVLAPSLYEGFGLQIAEASAFGKPVITSNCSAMPEVCGGAGLLVDPYDEFELTSAIDRLAADTKLRRALGEQGLRNNSTRSWKKIAAATIAVIEKANGN